MPAKINISTITSDKYKKLRNFQIMYNCINTKFGQCILGANDNRLCYIAFYDIGQEHAAFDNMRNDWPNAIFKQENDDVVHDMAEHIFSDVPSEREVNVLLKGTDLQVAIWKQLTNIRPGTTASYEQIAQAVGKPTAVRAVANAIAKNRVAYVIPCHRVIQKSGRIGKYRWGVQVKEQMLHSENIIC